MSQSPLEAKDGPSIEAAASKEARERTYLDGWDAINRLMRQGWSWSGNERNRAYLGLGGGRFADVSAVTGFDWADDGRAIARVDWDLDGDQDFFVTNRSGPRLRYVRNGLVEEGLAARSGARFLGLRLRGSTANTDGIGARVEVEARHGEESRLLVHEVRAGEGYQAQSSAWIHAGLGAAEPRSVTVRWPGGEAERFEGVEADGFFVLEQGSGRARRFDPPTVTARSRVPASEAPRAGSASRLVLARPLPMPPLALTTPSGERAELYRLQPDGRLRSGDHPLLLNLWASWCAPCRGELAGLTAHADELASAGVRVLAVSLDGGDERAEAARVLGELGWPHSSAFAAAATVEVLEAITQWLSGSELRMPVPTSLLIDAEGGLRVVYSGPVDVETVLADARLVSADEEELLAAATPFPGTFFRDPPGLELEAIEQHLARRGHVDASRQMGLLRTRVLKSSAADLLVEFARRRIAERRLAEAVEHLEAALEAQPDHVEALLELGRIDSVEGRHVQALERLRRATELAPDSAVARHFLGFALAASGDLEGAERELGILQGLDAERAKSLAATIESRRPGEQRQR